MAELMLSGLLCENCGEMIDDMQEVGYPRKCESCDKKIDRAPTARSTNKC